MAAKPLTEVDPFDPFDSAAFEVQSPETTETTEPASDSVVLSVVDPLWVESFHIEISDADGDTLEITREGTEVPKDLVEHIISEAVKHGVVVTEGDHS